MNPLASDANTLGCLTPGPELLKQLMRQPLGSTPLRVCSGGSTSRCAGDGCWTLDLRRHRQVRYHENSAEKRKFGETEYTIDEGRKVYNELVESGFFEKGGYNA